MSRYPYRLFALVATLVLVSCWAVAFKLSAPNRQARAVWEEYEEVLLEPDSEMPGLDFESAVAFFERLTGIVVPANPTYAGVLPTKETGTALGPLRRWYSEHGDQLYLDESTGEVKVKPPKEPVEKAWWAHEQVLVDVIGGKNVDAEELTAARKLFGEICKVQFEARRLRMGEKWVYLGDPEALKAIRACYQNRRRWLYVDQAGNLRVRDGR